MNGGSASAKVFDLRSIMMAFGTKQSECASIELANAVASVILAGRAACEPHRLVEMMVLAQTP